ncbi:TonB-dependent receptor [Flavipsychrobacter stenotrophus]|uniref:TonB-dependent receptor n=1 Tax=Flavipsychrobacter stenotrophus TaxID=2077091 RepID=A0A2S7SYI2_9BACT|nr:TonB-dependent receptor [Flavipsychrobacter stenotrophus]PQJ11681.1 TonB-dependent receptor [Flavipsychrobacter stenotrophus]
MVRFINTMVLLAVLVSLPFFLKAQNCNYLVHGIVTDKGNHPMPGVIVRLVNDSTGTATDTSGSFSFTNVCPGSHNISFEFIGYKKIAQVIDVSADRYITITLSTSENELGEVVVNGEKKHELHTVLTDELKGVKLLQTRGSSLGETMKGMTGLNSLQTGPSLSKPVIHGLHSNRVLLINDGVRQNGQQWGSDHAPEIDPFVTNKITVVKGAASVRYGADAVGGVVLLEPDDLPTEKSINGNLYAIAASNGHSSAVSGTLQGAFGKKLEGLSWRVQGTLKQAGNSYTRNYYLANTGMKEGDFSANTAYKWKKFTFNLFYSQYNARMGIFAGAQSSSPLDLLAKIISPTPLSPSYFSYKINRSYQNVTHDLLKANVNYKLANNAKLDLTFGRQEDLREEFDASLPYSTNPDVLEKPQVSFKLITHSLDLIYTSGVKNGFSGSAGLTGNTSGNVFAGIRYLIPNFRDYNGGAFAIERYNYKKFTFEAGARYDYRWLRVYQRNTNTLELFNTTYNYQNLTGTAGASYRYNAHLTFTGNIGTAWRAPSINEMYINGEHFSSATFEVGDSGMKSERSVNTTLSANYTGDKWRITADLYYNKIGNYIYSMPTGRDTVLISGTFPKFQYVQHDVNIKGIDLSFQYDFVKHFTFQSKTTIVLGYNESTNDYLIYMPANRFQNGITYQVHKIWKLNEPYITVENVSVSKQIRVPTATTGALYTTAQGNRGSDFAPPPAGYTLFNVNAGFTTPFLRHLLTVNVGVTNVGNVAYRDYLNHFRYYADDLGSNYVLRLKYSF